MHHQNGRPLLIATSRYQARRAILAPLGARPRHANARVTAQIYRA